MNIIGLSGKKQNGKSTVADIIQYLDSCKKGFSSNPNAQNFEEWRITSDRNLYLTDWEHKLFAEKLKQIVALLIGCKRGDLEDENFKNSALSKEWDRLKFHYSYDGRRYSSYFNSEKEAEDWLKEEGGYGWSFEVEKTTPRKLLQLIGTNCLRDIIHPQIHVNALFSDYKPIDTEWRDSANSPGIDEFDIYPKWIISDVRFENEVKAIKSKGGVIFRVNNPRIVSTDNHPSETSLDNYKFDEYIVNSGTIDNLIKKVSIILKNFNIL